MQLKDNFGCKTTMAKAIKAAHYVDIRVRVDGKYVWFEGDFLKELLKHVEFVPSEEIQSCSGRQHHIGDRFGG